MPIELLVRPSPTESFIRRHQGRRIGLGRNEQNDLRFEGEGADLVSGSHAEITIEGSGAQLRDLDSSNGTYLNDQQVVRKIELKVGDEICLGKGGPRIEIRNIEVPPESASVPTAINAAARSDSVGEVSPPNTAKGQKHVLPVAIATACLLLAGAVAYFAATNSAESTAPVQPRTEPVPPTVASTLSTNQEIISPPQEPDHAEDDEASLVAVKLDEKAIVEQCRDGVVWMGLEFKDLRVPVCTGVAIGPDRVATTGYMARHLASDMALGAKAFVYLPGEEDAVVYITEAKTHPRFDHEKPDDDATMHHNLGLAILEHKLASYCEISEPERWLRAGAEVVMLGYPMTPEMRRTAYDPLNPPQLDHRKIIVGAGTIAPHDISFPRRELGIASSPIMDGAALFAPNGKLVAVVHQPIGSAYGIIASQFADFSN